MSETPKKTDTPITDKAKFTDDPKGKVGFVVDAWVCANLEKQLTAANERAARLEGDAKRLDAVIDSMGQFHVTITREGIDQYIIRRDAAIRPDSAQKENKS